MQFTRSEQNLKHYSLYVFYATNGKTKMVNARTELGGHPGHSATINQKSKKVVKPGLAL
jgi:hypothetical protein